LDAEDIRIKNLFTIPPKCSCILLLLESEAGRTKIGFEGTINFKFPLMKINIVATMFGVRSSQIFEKENYE